MLKRKIDRYIQQYYERSHNALLITGARQIGKTFSIRQFGKSFKSFIEINFIDSPDAVKMIDSASDSKDLLLRLSAYANKPMIKGETLFFFDEIQECPKLVTAIKFLVEEGSYRYIMSGALLGVELKDLRSEPVGYLGIKEMYPLDFEEFLTCVGINDDVLAHIRNAWENKSKVDDFVHKKLIELFRLYLIVGGMPAAVNAYLESNNLQNVIATQRDILTLYKKDISKYDPEDKLYIEEIFNLIPQELNAKNKRFILKKLNENIKFSKYEHSFIWLKNAGVALPAYNVEEPKVPLILSRSRNLFKLFQNDLGILACQYTGNIQLRILSGDKDINFGSIYENAVAQELTANGFSPCYYNNKRRGGIDFIIEINGEVLPIEVKSGKDYEQHRALSNILDCTEYRIPQALVLSNDNLKVAGKIIYAPIYMTMFLKNDEITTTNYSIDLQGLI